MYDIIIIGAGVAGGFMAKELSKFDLKILLLDMENDVGNGTSMANSAIIHAGYDAKAGYKKGDFNSAGNKMYDKVCEELDVEFTRCGSLVIGFDEEDRKTIEHLYENGIRNDVPDMKILSGDEAREIEPTLTDEVCCALYAPSAGIISPFTLCVALAEVAVQNGVELSLETKVEGIKKTDFGYELDTTKGKFQTKYVINAAGVYSDDIHDMVGEPYFKITARRGSYFLLDKEAGYLAKHVIFQCPSAKGKGVLISPTVHGNIIIGPDADPVPDKNDKSTTLPSLDFIRETAKRSCKDIPFGKNIRVFAGLRSTGSTGDFILEESPSAEGFFNIGGYESPGLSSIPAVAKYMEDIIVKAIKRIEGRDLEAKADYNPIRRKQVRFHELGCEEKKKLIEENPLYGRIICRCEEVTEAEIVDAIKRCAGARTLKGIKKRCRPGSGRCQGGFCSPRVQEILARELNKKMEDIPYDSSEAYILTGQTKS